MEQALIYSLSNYAFRRGDKRLSDFVEAVLSSGANPSPHYIKLTLGRFDVTWVDQIEQHFSANGTSEVSSIVSNRNRIAHGQSVSLGIASIRSWSPAARALSLEIIRIVESA
jgi:hypothetical protein